METDFHKKMLRFVVLPTRLYPDEYAEDMARAYQCWRQVWAHAFQEEMNVRGELYSDGFTRKSHVAILFYGEEPLGLCTSNILNLKLQQDLDDSYFEVWPEKVQEELKARMDKVMTCCNATINFTFRKSRLGFNSLELLFAMMIHYMKSTEDVGGILGTARREKGVEKICHRLEGVSLMSDLPYTIPGQFIDLILWDRNLDMNHWSPEMQELTHHIWNHSTEIIRLPSYQGVKNAA